MPSPTKRSRVIEHLVLPQSAGERVPQEERGREVLDLARGERQRRRAVDRQLQPREEARVVGEQTARLVADVAEVVADAEGRSFEDREHQSRTMRVPDACASAIDDDLVDVHVRRPRDREEDAVRDVLGAHRPPSATFE